MVIFPVAARSFKLLALQGLTILEVLFGSMEAGHYVLIIRSSSLSVGNVIKLFEQLREGHECLRNRWLVSEEFA